MFEQNATPNNPAIANIVVSYNAGVGSATPSGVISINLAMVTVLASINNCKSMGDAPKVFSNLIGSIAAVKSKQASSVLCLRK